MPDNIINESTITNRRAPRRARVTKDQPLLDGAQMRDLSESLRTARAEYREENEAHCIKVYSDALDRIADARTIDPAGIALKLEAVAEYRDDAAMLADLANGTPLRRAIAGTIRDLRASASELSNSAPATAPSDRSPTGFARALAVAAQPHVEEGGGIKDRAGLVAALSPMIGAYTIADAVAAIGGLRTTAEVIRGDEAIDDALFAAIGILEDFCCYADAADAESVAARAHLIEMAISNDVWDLGPVAMQVVTHSASWDIRSLRNGKFDKDNRGTTFSSGPTARLDWLYQVISARGGVTEASEYAEARRQQEQPDEEAVGA